MKKIFLTSLFLISNIFCCEFNKKNFLDGKFKLSERNYFADEAKNKRVQDILMQIENFSWYTDRFSLDSAYNNNKFDKPLYFALNFSPDIVIAYLIIMDTNLFSINQPDRYGILPLQRACIYGQSLIIKLLLEFGADPFKKDKNNQNTFELLLTWISRSSESEIKYKNTFNYLTRCCAELGLFKLEQ